MKYTVAKIKKRLWGKIVSSTRDSQIYPFLYRSYWHSLLLKKKNSSTNLNYYFTACPNPGAGIGHQMANWIAGYWWSKQFNLKFAHIPFSTVQWDSFLGFGENEITVTELQKQGYSKVKLPLFNPNTPQEMKRTRQIIRSFSGEKVIFICEQDQGYMEQYGVMEDIQHKFFTAPSRKNDILIYSCDYYNIAIHVRRGDIVIGQKTKNPNLLMRWQNIDYFTNVLTNVLKTVKKDKPVAIYLFSQGETNDFNDFNHFPNLQLCLEMSARDSFLHMVNADLLITSKSSFSYKPALLNKGIKVCPKNFWHGYPKSEDWILADEDGNLVSLT